MISGKVQDLVGRSRDDIYSFFVARQMPFKDVKTGQGVPVPPNAKQAH